MKPSRITIIGANFAGLKAAQALSRDHDVVVIDANGWFEWLPNIHELVSGVKRPGDLRLSRKRVVEAAGHRFLHVRVEAIDAARGQLHLATGRTLPFDACIVAVGGVHDASAVSGAEHHAMPFKNVAQCVAIGRRLVALLRRRTPTSVVIVGAGLEGIEALGEILRRHRHRKGLSITVVEAAKRLLPDAPRGVDSIIRRHCEELPVRFAVNSPATEIRDGSLQLASGERLDCDLCVWSAGAAAPPLLRDSALAPKPKQWAPVRASLQSRAFDNVFVAGDAAALPRRLPKQAFHALQMGEHAAHNAARLLAGKKLEAFIPSPKPMLVTFGDIDTFLVYETMAFAGTAFAAVKEAIFQLTMARLDPPTSPNSLAALGDRLSNGLAATLPPLLSPARLLRMSRVQA